MSKRRSDEAIEPLLNVPVDVMEKILENASSGLIPVEIDGIVYRIPKAISDLIDSLYLMIENKKIDEKEIH